MNDNAQACAESWFVKADEDDLSIRAILKENGAPSTACFLSQQMAEKYLKGLLVLREQYFPKTHDLLELESLLAEADFDTTEIHDNLVLLNRYYVETRYPGDFPEFTEHDANEAHEAAQKVKSFARSAAT